MYHLLELSFLVFLPPGANAPACAFYKRLGCTVASVQNIFHAWLPQHLVEPEQRSDLAPIPFCKQHLTGQELQFVTEVLSSGHLDSASRFTSMCSLRLQELLGNACDRVVMVPSGTAALELAALLANLAPGDEVIMPSYTFSSTANAFVLRHCVPVFVDVRLDTLSIDETLIEAAITSKTKAICCVHYAGIPCEMDEIMALAHKHNLIVIEDAAQGNAFFRVYCHIDCEFQIFALNFINLCYTVMCYNVTLSAGFLSTYKGRQLGTIGHFGCFSFHYTKNVICGEGGALSINNLPAVVSGGPKSPKEGAARAPSNSSRALVLWEKGTNRYDL
jgi:dTDP-4-amino-4,6-dideoxygalactose transaminase